MSNPLHIEYLLSSKDSKIVFKMSHSKINRQQILSTP